MTDTVLCLFNACHNTALACGKCDAHKTRAKCMVDDCRNQTYARNLCVKHGGKLKCIADNCTANARSHGLCCRHGPKAPNTICSVDGCTMVAHARRRCVRHGGGRVCSFDDCTAFARSAGRCGRHSSLLALSDAALDLNVTSPSSSGGSDATADKLFLLLKESSVLHIDNAIEAAWDSKCTVADAVSAEFSLEDCDWLEFMVSDLVF